MDEPSLTFETDLGQCTVHKDTMEILGHQRDFFRGVSRRARRTAMMTLGVAMMGVVAVTSLDAPLGLAALAVLFVGGSFWIVILDFISFKRTGSFKLHRDQITSVTANPPIPSISRGHFQVLTDHTGRLERYTLAVDGEDGPDSPYRAAERTLLAYGWLEARCRGCSQPLLHTQLLCPECGEDRSSVALPRDHTWAHSKCERCKYELLEHQPKCPECGLLRKPPEYG